MNEIIFKVRETVKKFVDNFNNLQTIWRSLIKLTDIIPWYFWKIVSQMLLNGVYL